MTQVNGHVVHTSSTIQTASQVITGAIKKLIAMTSQMNKIAVSNKYLKYVLFQGKRKSFKEMFNPILVFALSLEMQNVK